MSDKSIIHICRPLDSTRTLCGLPGARVAAVNWSEHFHARGPFCPECFNAAHEEKRRERERWDAEDAAASRNQPPMED